MKIEWLIMSVGFWNYFKKKYYDHQFQIYGLPFSKVKLGNKELFGHPTIVQ